MRILLVEDDPQVGDAVAYRLRRECYRVDWVRDGEAALAAATDGTFDLVVLDLGLPRLDGCDVLGGLRARDIRTPVLVLTARDALSDRVRGLDLGADDYLVKPFDIAEFEARVRSLLRRQAGLRAAEVAVGQVLLDLTARRFLAAGQPMELPAREHALLELLFMRAGKVVPKETIMQSMTTLDDSLSDNAIEQYASRLRRRLAPFGVQLRTARGIGYYIDKGA